MSIDICHYDIDNDETEKFVNYCIRLSVASSGKHHCYVKRRYNQFLSLNEDLLKRYPVLKLPTFPKKKLIGSSLQSAFIDERRSLLEKYLQELVEIPMVVNSPRFIEFLDNSPALLAIYSNMDDLTRHVGALDTEMFETKSALKTALATIEKLVAKMAILESKDRQNQPNNIMMSGGIDNNSSNNSSSTHETSIHDAPWQSNSMINQLWSNVDHSFDINFVSSPVTLPPLHPNPNPDPEPITDRVSRQTDVSRTSGGLGIDYQFDEPSIALGYFVQNIVEAHDSTPLDEGLDRDVALLDESGDESNNSWKSIALSLGFRMSDERALAYSNAISDNTIKFLEPSLKYAFDAIGSFAETPLPELVDVLVDEVIGMILPTDAQICYRNSISSFICKHARLSCSNAHVYEIGVNALQSFLPDDPIQMSIYLSKGQEPGWYIRLNEKLCRVSGGMSSSDVMAGVGESRPHALTNVSFINDHKNGYKLRCLVDTSVGVEILANSRSDLCLLAFFEEFDRIVGRGHLFKKSLLVLRAWLIYEANLANVVPDTALALMLCTVFNEHHSMIHKPSQALYAFFLKYSGIDLSSFVITLNGLIPLELYNDYANMKSLFSENNLLSEAVVQKYQKLEQAVDELNAVSDLVASPFPSRPLMIEHPFLAKRLNMLPDGSVTVMVRRASRISEAISSAAKVFGSIANTRGGRNKNSPQVDSNASSIRTVMDNFFQQTISRFGTGWKPDCPKVENSLLSIGNKYKQDRFDSNDSMTDRNSITHISPIVSNEYSNFSDKTDRENGNMIGTLSIQVNLDKIIEKIKYCNLLLECQINESSLRLLTLEILSDKGPLPVGEIGKILQDLSHSESTSMSVLLKEKFGGLKKFVEKYPDDFVIGVDHPFNPHVYVRSLLTTEDQSSVFRGDMLRAPMMTPKARKQQQRVQRNSLGRRSVSRSTPPLEWSPEYYGASAHGTSSRDTIRLGLGNDAIRGGGYQVYSNTNSVDRISQGQGYSHKHFSLPANVTDEAPPGMATRRHSSSSNLHDPHFFYQGQNY